MTRRKRLTLSLVMLVAGLGGMAWFAWAWHDQEFPVQLLAFGVGLTVVGAGGLVLHVSGYFADDMEDASEDAEEEDWESVED